MNTDLQENLPPKAPENRTQYLSSIQKNFGISENRKMRFEKFSQGLFKENVKNLSSNSHNSNSNDKINTIAKKTAKFCEKLTQNLSLNEVNEKRNSKKSENFTVAEKENVIPTFGEMTPHKSRTMPVGNEEINIKLNIHQKGIFSR